MPRINLLDKKTAELIAAGEVIERPASIVKELLENAIDSDAKNITIEIQNGGKTYIRVSDDGCGIEAEDLPKAVLRHATSKISNENDLDEIKTLGFRGEALASIAAVSKLQILSCTKDSVIGSRIELSGGEEIYYGEAGAPKGTTVVVKDLFFNTPARMKFLKKDSTEGSYIQNICEKVFISNPEISFRFIKNGDTVLTTPGDGKLISAIYAVYGADFAKSLTEVAYSFGDYSVKGFVSKPTEARANRNMQIFYVNDRYIKSKTLYAAVEEAYKGSIMTGKFPACVLFIDIPFGLVDVNVHPAKTEIRFAEEKSVFHTVYHAAYAGVNASAEIPVKIDNKTTERFYYEPIENKEQTTIFHSPTPKLTYETKRATEEVSNFIYETFNNSVSKLTNDEKYEENREVFEEIPVMADNFTHIEQETTPKKEPNILAFKYIGQLFETYILGEYEEDLILIDKHAAHERLIFEELKQKTEENIRQILLSPIKVSLDANEFETAISSTEKLNKIGFGFNEFGASTILIREAPINISMGEIKNSFLEVLELISKNSRRPETEIYDELLHSVACRSAIKAHDRSSDEELSNFAQRVIESDARYCPHGRPIFVRFSKKEIEKKFFRTL